MTNEQRTNETCTPLAPGSSMGTCTTRNYDSGGLEYGVQLGVRTGAVAATAGAVGEGTAMAIDAHADVTVATERWGVGLSSGYTSDRMFGENNSYFYSGIPIVLYGQFGLSRRIFVHGGGGRIVHGAVKRIEPDEISVSAGAWRGVAGITFVFARSAKRDLALRLEARVQRSSDAMIDGQDASWSSTGLLAELIWATF